MGNKEERGEREKEWEKRGSTNAGKNGKESEREREQEIKKKLRKGSTNARSSSISLVGDPLVAKYSLALSL